MRAPGQKLCKSGPLPAAYPGAFRWTASLCISGFSVEGLDLAMPFRIRDTSCIANESDSSCSRSACASKCHANLFARLDALKSLKPVLRSLRQRSPPGLVVEALSSACQAHPRPRRHRLSVTDGGSFSADTTRGPGLLPLWRHVQVLPHRISEMLQIVVTHARSCVKFHLTWEGSARRGCQCAVQLNVFCQSISANMTERHATAQLPSETTGD